MRYYEARFWNGQVKIRWEESTGEYGSPSEWAAGYMEIIRGKTIDGIDLMIDKIWVSPSFEGNHLDRWGDWESKPDKAVEKLKNETQKDIIQKQKEIDVLFKEIKLLKGICEKENERVTVNRQA